MPSSRPSEPSPGAASDWRMPGARAAVCFSIDDIHPTAASGAHGVGDVARAALTQLDWLLQRHPQLRVTAFITPDWRSAGVYPTQVLHRVPGLRRLTYATPVLPRGTLRLDRHPSFVAFLRRLPRTDFAIHGLHHVKRGPNHLAEYEGRTTSRCRALLEEAMAIMTAAGLPVTPGVAPPVWVAPDPLLEAMARLKLSYVASARDLQTPIAPDARTAGSGRRGSLLIHPERLPFGSLVHVPTNFQGPAPPERAFAIIEAGGLLSVKAHLLKRFGAYEAIDGLDRPFVEHLDRLFTTLEDRYGDTLWWTTMAEAADACRARERQAA